jgi:[acyl-carrier-protein] S-malonyltransferase
LNSPKQTVIAGDAAAIDRALEILKARGVRKVVKLNVSAPFHCALMRPAQERLASDLEGIEFKDLSVPLVTNVDAKLIASETDARDALVRQVTSTVRWSESIELLTKAHGVGTFVEVGPGKVLAGLLRQIAPEARALNAGDAEGVEAARVALAETGAAGGA